MKKTIFLALSLCLCLISSSMSEPSPTEPYTVLDLVFEVPIGTETEIVSDGEFTSRRLYPPSIIRGSGASGMIYFASYKVEGFEGDYLSIVEADAFYSDFFLMVEDNEGYDETSASTHLLNMGQYLHHRVFSETINGKMYYNDCFAFLIGERFYFFEFSSSFAAYQILPHRIKPLFLRTLTIGDLTLSISLLKTLHNESNDIKNLGDYKDHGYRTIARYPYDYIGELASFTGEVVQVIEHGLDAVYRVRVEGNEASRNDIIYVDYVRSSEREARILEGDRVQLYGVLDGLETYSTVLRSQANIPRLIAYTIRLLGN